jgi:3-oxoadipate CoA-transferase alpha subunit
MIDKFVRSMAEAMDGIRTAPPVLIAGFGDVGSPNALLEGLIEQGRTDLTLVVNSAGRVRRPGQPAQGAVARLIEMGRVRKVITSFVRANSVAGEWVTAGSWRRRWCPRARWPSASAPRAPASPPSSPQPARTPWSRGQGGARLRRPPLHPGARPARRRGPGGGLDGRPLGQPGLPRQQPNFNPIMAMAGTLTIVQTHHLCDLGQLPANEIVTPGIFVDRVLHVPAGDPALPG